MSDATPDQFNPTLALQGTHTRNLVKIATGELDARELAICELAARGLHPTTGAWIGFASAGREAQALLAQIREGQA